MSLPLAPINASRGPEPSLRNQRRAHSDTRNTEFAAHGFAPGLRIIPSLKVFIIGCVDPRVDPAQILGIELGEGAVIQCARPFR
jgi:carbonic anhydrase